MSRDSSTSVCVAQWTILDPPAAARTPAFATHSFLIDTTVLASQVMVEDSLIDRAAQVMVEDSLIDRAAQVMMITLLMCAL